jgi:hypothetical protein
MSAKKYCSMPFLEAAKYAPIIGDGVQAASCHSRSPLCGHIVKHLNCTIL